MRRVVLLLALCACDRVFGLEYIDDPKQDAPLPIDVAPDGVAPVTYVNEVLADGPIGYYRLGETTGVTAANVIATGPAGDYVGTFQQGATGALAGDPDTALALDRATPGAVDVGDNYDFPGQAPFSIEVWIQPPDPPDGDYHEIVSKWQQPPARDGIELFYINDEVRFAREVAGGVVDVVAASPLNRGAYNHVVATFDGAMLRLYLNGTRLAVAPSAAVLLDNSYPFQIGNGGSAGFTGTIDEVAIYDHALAPDRVNAHFHAAQSD